MDLEIPSELAAERALWSRLTVDMLGLSQDALSGRDEPNTPTGHDVVRVSTPDTAS
jgi:hypothetical protein